MPSRVFVLEAQPFVHDLYSELLPLAGDVELQGAASSAEDALEQIREQAPDLLVVDLSLPAMNGLETIWYLAEYRPELPVLVVSSQHRDAYDQGDPNWLGANVKRYVTKGEGAHKVIEAIYTILNGMALLSMVAIYAPYLFG